MTTIKQVVSLLFLSLALSVWLIPAQPAEAAPKPTDQECKKDPRKEGCSRL